MSDKYIFNKKEAWELFLFYTISFILSNSYFEIYNFDDQFIFLSDIVIVSHWYYIINCFVKTSSHASTQIHSSSSYILAHTSGRSPLLHKRPAPRSPGNTFYIYEPPSIPQNSPILIPKASPLLLNYLSPYIWQKTLAPPETTQLHRKML